MKDVTIADRKKVKKKVRPVDDVNDLVDARTKGERQLSVKAGFRIETKNDDDDDEEIDFIPAKSSSSYKLKEADADEFISRTTGLLERLDAERAENPFSENSNILYEFYKATLAETLEMVPRAKRNFMRYQSLSNANTYNGLVTKCQELIADLQALSTRGDLLERVIDSTIRPSFRAIASNLANSYTEALGSIKSMDVTDSQRENFKLILSTLVRATGDHLQEVQSGIINDLSEKLGEN